LACSSQATRSTGAVALDLVRELDGEARAVEQIDELGAALLDQAVAQILAVDMQEIERH
jgi:hypothetical protein